MSANLLLESIKTYLRRKRLTSIEKKRLNKDLEAVFERLQKKEYQKFSYSQNKFDVPDRTKQIYTELEFYALIGRTWEQLLKALNINSFSTIVDLCPGYAPKIELGLFYLGYKGEVVIVDRDPASFLQIKQFMRLFNSQFKITTRKVDLFGNLKFSADIVLGNHIIDDLVMYYFAKKAGLTLDDIYQKEGNFKFLWQKILINQEKSLKEIAPIIISLLTNLTKKNGYICLVHYKSYMEKLLDLDEATKFNKRLFLEIKQQLLKEAFKDQTNLAKRSFIKGHFKLSDGFILQKR